MGWGLTVAVGLCWIVGMGCRSGFELILCGGPVVLWVCGGCEFCVMVVAPWVSDLLLVVVGCSRGVGWPCGLPVYVVGEVWEKKNYGFYNILIGK
jgi:hypothetical protein